MARQRKRKATEDKPEAVPPGPPARAKDKPTHRLTFAKFEKDAVAQDRYIKALEQGATLAGAAKKAGVSRYLIREYGKGNADFSLKAKEARNRGIDQMSEDVEDALYRAAKGGNVVAMLCWLYNRKAHMWKDMRSFALKGLDDVLKLLPPEFAGRLRPLLAGAIPA